MAKELLVGIAIGASIKAGFTTVFGRAEHTAKMLGREIERTTKANEAFGRSLRSPSMQRWTGFLQRGTRQYAAMSMQIAKAAQAQRNLNKAIAEEAKASERRRTLRGGLVESFGHAAATAVPIISSVRRFMAQEDASVDLKVVMMQKGGGFGRFGEIDRLTGEWGTALPGNKADFSNMVRGLKSQGISDDTIINGGGLATARLNTVMGIPIADGSFFAKNMEAHGIKESELLSSADLTQRASFAAGLSSEDMYQAMSYYAAKANSLGLTGLENQKQIYAVEGLAANKGLEGSSFGTNFSMMLSQLSRGPRMVEEAKRGMKADVRRMMEKSGAQFEFFNPDGTMKSLREVTGILETGFGKIRARFGDQGVIDIADALFGQEGGRVANILGQAGVAGFDGMIAKMEQQASLEERIKVRTSSLSSSLEALGGVADQAAAAFGEAFASDIKDIAEYLQGFLNDSLIPFIQNNRNVIKSFFGLSAGFFGLKLALLGASYGISMFMMPFKSISTSFKKMQAMNSLFRLLRLEGVGKGVALLRAFGVSSEKAVWISAQFAKVIKPLSPMLARIGAGVGVFGKLAVVLGMAKHAVLAFGRALLVTPVGWIALAVAAAALVIYKYWKPIKAFFQGFGHGLKQALAPLVPLLGGVGRIFSRIWATVKPFFQPLLDWFSDFFTVTQVSAGSARSFGEAIGLWIGGKIAAVTNWCAVKINQIKSVFSGGLNGIIGLILKWSPLQAFYSSFSAVLSWFGVELPATFTQFGGNIIGGLWDGLKAKFEGLKAWFADQAAWFKNAFAYTNGIRSPSRVFKRFGGWMMEGLNIGLSAGAARPLATVNEVATDLQRRFTNGGALSADLAGSIRGNAAEFAAARQGNAGGITVHFNPVIHAPGGESKQIQSALQTGLREFEMLFNRLMDERARGAY